MIPWRYNLRNLFVRSTTSAMTSFGVAMVVMVTFSLIAFVEGLRRTVTFAAQDKNCVILARGMTVEPASSITREQYEILRSRPEIAKGQDDQPLLSPEMVTGFQPEAPSPSSGPQLLTFVRGVYPIAYQVHNFMRFLKGRAPAPGSDELAVGCKLAQRYSELSLDQSVRFGRRQWMIVGIFSDRGSARESEAWADLDVLQQDIQYRKTYNTLHATLIPGGEESLSKTLRGDSRLNLDVVSERRFYSDQANLANQLQKMGLVVALVLGIGVAFGGMNTMYSALARRSREIGVLRALGFGRLNVTLSFLCESLCLALVGAFAGEIMGLLVLAIISFSGRLMTVGGFLFPLYPSATAFISGLTIAVLVGVFGGIFPALRAARQNVIDALHRV